ncbi:hypothetical protein GPJ56_010210 [Histomonas meleagridis]|uniref:uncharacterized protein n=1 Tax=Histomonas meleagridis TaxID=135588 RepID=UPI0035593ED3|nr:hypothetical protein GPJ56_010210 [Histomonas meleagridis]KAH0797079.1 hypothetical protein GO595_010972 [Histomonas meleagridis]
MINANKIPRIFGRQVLQAIIAAKVHHTFQEESIYMTLGHNECEIFNQSWERCYHCFPIANGKADLDQEGMVHIVYTVILNEKPQKSEFYIKYDRPEIIINAFNSGEGKKKSDSGQMSIIEPAEILSFACDFPRNIAQDKFRPFLESQARKRVMFLTSSNEISESLVSAIAIEFKMRFPQIEPENWTEAFEVLWLEFVAFVVSLWTQCLKIAIEPHTGPNSFEYFRRLTASISGMIAKGADVFQVDRRNFLLAARKFLDSGDFSELPTASRSLVADVELALGNVRKRWLLQLTDLFGFVQLFSAAITIGQAVTSKSAEAKNLSDMLSSWTKSLVDTMTRGPRMNDFRNGVEKLAVAVLKENDAKRYSPDFHCVLALWKLSELVKASD